MTNEEIIRNYATGKFWTRSMFDGVNMANPEEKDVEQFVKNYRKEAKKQDLEAAQNKDDLYAVTETMFFSDYAAALPDELREVFDRHAGEFDPNDGLSVYERADSWAKKIMDEINYVDPDVAKAYEEREKRREEKTENTVAGKQSGVQIVTPQKFADTVNSHHRRDVFTLGLDEAKLILGYEDGHGFSIGLSESGSFVKMDSMGDYENEEVSFEDILGDAQEWSDDLEEFEDNEKLADIGNRLYKAELAKKKASDYVLEKLSAAGIEVVTDKAEFEKILATTERLQKMARKLDDFQKLKNELDGLNKKSKETKQNVIKTENSLALDNQERYEKDFVELKDTILRLSDFIDDETYKKLNSRIFNQNNIELLDLYPFEENKENRYVLGILNSELYDSGIYEYLSLRKSDFMAHVFVDEIGKEIEASETTTENFAKYIKNCSENFHAKRVEDEIYESLKEQIDAARKDIEKNINIIFVNKNINSLTAKENYELKQKLLQLPYIEINGVNVYANKIDEVNKKQFLDELQLSKLFEKHGYEVFILPEQYTEKQKHADVLETEKGNDIENGDFLDLKNLTTKNIRQVGKKFSEGKEQARDVLIYLHEDFSDKDLVHEIDWRIKHELQPQNINGKLVVVFEKSHQYLEYAIKKDGIQPIIKDSVKPSVQAEAEKNIPATPPKNIIPQSENLSSGKIQFMIQDKKESAFKVEREHGTGGVVITHIASGKDVYLQSGDDANSFFDSYEEGKMRDSEIMEYFSDEDKSHFVNDMGITYNQVGETTYGFTHNNKIYLNPDVMNSEAAVHEYTHLWDEYTRRTNPELWEKGKDILSKTRLWNEVKSDPNYADIADDDNLVLSECHARVCGKIAAQVLERIASRDGEIAKDAVIDWDKEMKDYVYEEFYYELEALQYQREAFTPYGESFLLDAAEFLAQPMKDLVNGLQITRGVSYKNINSKEKKENNMKDSYKPLYEKFIENRYQPQQGHADGFAVSDRHWKIWDTVLDRSGANGAFFERSKAAAEKEAAEMNSKCRAEYEETISKTYEGHGAYTAHVFDGYLGRQSKLSMMGAFIDDLTDEEYETFNKGKKHMLATGIIESECPSLAFNTSNWAKQNSMEVSPKTILALVPGDLRKTEREAQQLSRLGVLAYNLKTSFVAQLDGNEPEYALAIDYAQKHGLPCYVKDSELTRSIAESLPFVRFCADENAVIEAVRENALEKHEFTVADRLYLDRISETLGEDAVMYAERITRAEADAKEFYEDSVQKENGYSFKEYAAGQMAVGFIQDKFPEINKLDDYIGFELDEIGTKIATGEITKENLRSELDKIAKEAEKEKFPNLTFGENFSVEKANKNDAILAAVNEAAADLDVELKINGVQRYTPLESSGTKANYLVEYEGDAREDDLFNALAEQDIEDDATGLPADINPITPEKSGTIEEYLERIERWRKEDIERHSEQIKVNEAAADLDVEKIHLKGMLLADWALGETGMSRQSGSQKNIPPMTAEEGEQLIRLFNAYGEDIITDDAERGRVWITEDGKPNEDGKVFYEDILKKARYYANNPEHIDLSSISDFAYKDLVDELDSKMKGTRYVPREQLSTDTKNGTRLSDRTKADILHADAGLLVRISERNASDILPKENERLLKAAAAHELANRAEGAYRAGYKKSFDSRFDNILSFAPQYDRKAPRDGSEIAVLDRLADLCEDIGETMRVNDVEFSEDGEVRIEYNGEFRETEILSHLNGYSEKLPLEGGVEARYSVKHRSPLDIPYLSHEKKDDVQEFMNFVNSTQYGGEVILSESAAEMILFEMKESDALIGVNRDTESVYKFEQMPGKNALYASKTSVETLLGEIKEWNDEIGDDQFIKENSPDVYKEYQKTAALIDETMQKIDRHKKKELENLAEKPSRIAVLKARAVCATPGVDVKKTLEDGKRLENERAEKEEPTKSYGTSRER